MNKTVNFRRPIFAGVVVAALIVHLRSLNIFFYNDDLVILQQLVNSHNIGSWLLTRFVDHIILVPKMFYALFFRLFGLNAVPWHLLILSLHVVNLILLNAILRKTEASFAARMFAVGCFGITTVFHECIYWVAAFTFLFCLTFSLSAVLAARHAEEHQSYVGLLAVAALVMLASFSTSVGFSSIVLVPISLLSMPAGRWSKRRAVVCVFIAAVAGCIPYILVSAGFIGSSAVGQFDPLKGSIFTARSIIERLAGRYFSGGQLPVFLSAGVLLILFAGALLPDGRTAHRMKRLIGPLAWLIVPTWMILAFRAWMGEAVFVSRYQLFPAVGFTWLLALAVDGFGRLPFVKIDRIKHAGLLAAFVILFGVQNYASYVAHQRWLERTEGLKKSHEEISKALRSLARSSQQPFTFSDHLIAGGQGWRPTLSQLAACTLDSEERKQIRFSEESAKSNYGLDPRLIPLVDQLRAGKNNWLWWIDDLSISQGSPKGKLGRAELILNARDLFTTRTGADFSFDDNGSVRVHPYGIGYLAEMTSVPRQDISKWEVIHFDLQSEVEGEALISFPKPDAPSEDHGARISLTGGSRRSITIDVPLAARGPITEPRLIKVTFTNSLTSYEIGPIAVWCNPACR